MHGRVAATVTQQQLLDTPVLARDVGPVYEVPRPARLRSRSNASSSGWTDCRRAAAPAVTCG
jgi:hypothetical protein